MGEGQGVGEVSKLNVSICTEWAVTLNKGRLELTHWAR